ncbi:hypothetical protein G3I71_41870 [Streptomyces sp. SID12501]|uniref:Uncharacterized protein n=2 Tax=Streptomyces sp. SID12501 TaxID=2706042 RepID=A0A6B3C5T1_9ACTN|nr:hypothetical protein [Streptomyces sp. SID12501]
MPTSNPLSEPSDLAVAVRVGQKMLARYGAVDSGDIFAYAQAHGGLTEALRILLRAVGAEVTQPRNLADLRERSDEPTGDFLGSQEAPPRCPAAHPEDPTPCVGPVVVTVLDAANAGADGCEHHGARLLASLDRGRVYALPDAPEGAAIRVFKAADTIRPFPWVDGPRTRDEQLSRTETRARGERP